VGVDVGEAQAAILEQRDLRSGLGFDFGGRMRRVRNC